MTKLFEAANLALRNGNTSISEPIHMPSYGLYAFSSHHGPAFTMTSRTQAHFEIHYVVEGKAQYHLGEKSIPVLENSMVFLRPNTTHHITAEQGQALILNVLCFQAKYLEETSIHRTLFEDLQALFPIENPHLSLYSPLDFLEIREHFKNLLFHQSSVRNEKTENNLQEQENPDGESSAMDLSERANKERHLSIEEHLVKFQNAELETIVSENARSMLVKQRHLGLRMWAEGLLLLHTIILAGRKTPRTASYGDIAVFNTLEYLQNNFVRPIKIEELADQMGVSYRLLTANFKKHTGNTIHQYISSLRLNYSMKLLKMTGNIVHSANNSGFEDISTFYRVFKKMTGDTPKKFIVTERLDKTLKTEKLERPSLRESIFHRHR